MRERYCRFSHYLRARFGDRVQKISVDAGFSCPNRDGAVSTEGCVFCDNRGFSVNTRFPERPLNEQIAEGIRRAEQRLAIHKFMVYFQAYSNTYASIETLRERYDVIKQFDGVVSLAIGTRPDCVNDEILDLIAEYADTYEVWIEYGLQSMHDQTLSAINRGHLCADFERALAMTRKRKNLKVCVHTIIGLPGETEDEILETARYLGTCEVDGIKIHPLHIVKGTALEALYVEKKYDALSLEEYALLVVRFLEYLSPKTVIQRLTAECPEDLLIAPEWLNQKGTVLGAIERLLTNRNTFQGKYFQK